MNFSFYSCLFYVDHLLIKKLELSKSNVDGKYILISTPNELFFLSVEILFSIVIFQTPFMTDFQDILYFYPEKKKSSLQETYFFNQGVSFLSLKKKYSLHTKMTSFVFLVFFFFFFNILVTFRFEILRF